MEELIEYRMIFLYLLQGQDISLKLMVIPWFIQVVMVQKEILTQNYKNKKKRVSIDIRFLF